MIIILISLKSILAPSVQRAAFQVRKSTRDQEITSTRVQTTMTTLSAFLPTRKSFHSRKRRRRERLRRGKGISL